MTDQHPRNLLGAYADGELTAEETARVAQHLTTCTECNREVALIRSMGGLVRGMVSDTKPRGLWGAVHARITQPIGWILLVAGVAVWVAMAVWEWYQVRSLSVPWLTKSAIWIGVALIAVGIGYEQLRDWKETRYKDVQR